MNKILIIPFLIILLSVCGLAITTQFNASDSVHSCTPNYQQGGGWVDNQNATDNNFNTLAYALPNHKAYCNWLFPELGGYQSAVLISRLADPSNPIHADTLPLSCLRHSQFNITALVFFNSTDSMRDPVMLYCTNTSGDLQLIRSAGYFDGCTGYNCRNFYELAINATYTGVANCPAKPTTPLFAQDDFSYTDRINVCYWSYEPHNLVVYPSDNQLCYNAAGIESERFTYYLPGEGNYYSAPVFSESFDLTLDNASYFEHTFNYLSEDGTNNPRPVLTMDFFAGNIQYYTMVNGTSSIESLCSNCFNPTNTNNIKIIVYNYDASGFTAFNSSSNTFQAIQPNTISLQINGGSPYFSIPVLNPGIMNVPNTALFLIDGGNMCLDNYLLYSGVNSNSVVLNITGIPFRQVGEKCDNSGECFTGYCNYLSICDKKGFMSACINGYECLSGKCSGGYCTQPSAWQIVDKVKTDAAGGDTNTNNMLSIILSLVFAIVAAVVLGVIGAGGVIAGGVGGIILLVSLFFFTMVGWLSAWILIAVVIVLVLLIVFMIVVGLNRGGV